VYPALHYSNLNLNEKFVSIIFIWISEHFFYLRLDGNHCSANIIREQIQKKKGKTKEQICMSICYCNCNCKTIWRTEEARYAFLGVGPETVGSNRWGSGSQFRNASATPVQQPRVPAPCCSTVMALFRFGFGCPELLQCVLNVYCSNSFVFGKNYPNFD
jgi:hypothetical protein